MAPVARSLAISSPLCPAAAFASTACRQVPSGSLHASTVRVHSPCLSGTTTASYRVLQDASRFIRFSGAACAAFAGARRLPLVAGAGGVHTTFAATASWPSRKTVAETVMVSPTTAFAG